MPVCAHVCFYLNVCVHVCRWHVDRTWALQRAVPFEAASFMWVM
jgi:hypothetical protein